MKLFGRPVVQVDTPDGPDLSDLVLGAGDRLPLEVKHVGGNEFRMRIKTRVVAPRADRPVVMLDTENPDT